MLCRILKWRGHSLTYPQLRIALPENLLFSDVRLGLDDEETSTLTIGDIVKQTIDSSRAQTTAINENTHDAPTTLDPSNTNTDQTEEKKPPLSPDNAEGNDDNSSEEAG